MQLASNRTTRYIAGTRNTPSHCSGSVSGVKMSFPNVKKTSSVVPVVELNPLYAVVVVGSEEKLENTEVLLLLLVFKYDIIVNLRPQNQINCKKAEQEY
jgi:hypothetical protein